MLVKLWGVIDHVDAIQLAITQGAIYLVHAKVYNDSLFMCSKSESQTLPKFNQLGYLHIHGYELSLSMHASHMFIRFCWIKPIVFFVWIAQLFQPVQVIPISSALCERDSWGNGSLSPNPLSFLATEPDTIHLYYIIIYIHE